MNTVLNLKASINKNQDLQHNLKLSLALTLILDYINNSYKRYHFYNPKTKYQLFNLCFFLLTSIYETVVISVGLYVR